MNRHYLRNITFEQSLFSNISPATLTHAPREITATHISMYSQTRTLDTPVFGDYLYSVLLLHHLNSYHRL